MSLRQCMGLDLSQKKTPTSRGPLVSVGWVTFTQSDFWL